MLTAGYILWMVQRSMFGPQVERFRDVRDATVMEMVPIGALVIAIMVVGIYPSLITDVFTEGVAPIVDSLQRTAAMAGLP